MMTGYEEPSSAFIETPTARNIIAFIEKVKLGRRAGMIVGASGVGKTATIEHVVRISEGSAKIITGMATIANTKATLSKIGQVIGCNAIAQSAAALYDRLEDFMSPNEFGEYNRHFECETLIIDEVQHVDLQALRVILELQKISRIPMIFVANRDVLKKTKTHDAALDQIANRIPFRTEIKTVHIGDIREFGIAHGVEGVDAYHYLELFGVKTNLHKLTYLLEEAHNLTGRRGSIRLQHLREAVAIMHGEDEDHGLFKLIPKSKLRQEESAA